MRAYLVKDLCEECDILSFLEGQEWKIFQDNAVIVNYSKEPAVDGHIVLQPRRHVERITQLSTGEWEKLSNLIFRYSRAVEKALNRRGKGSDEVDKMYLWCFCVPPHNHLHLHIKPKMKSVGVAGPDFVNYHDPNVLLDKHSIQDLMDEIEEFL